MKNLKRTKGNWTVEITDKIGVYSGSECVSFVVMPHYSNVDEYDESKKQALANAKLIAAAPDLFWSLCSIIDTLEHNVNPDDIPLFNEIQDAKKAIQKATE